jgi:hypothetical protein
MNATIRQSARLGSFPTSWDIQTDVAVLSVKGLINRVFRLSWKPSRMANSNFHVPEKRESEEQSNGRSAMSHKRTRRGASSLSVICARRSGLSRTERLASWAHHGANAIWNRARRRLSRSAPASSSPSIVVIATTVINLFGLTMKGSCVEALTAPYWNLGNRSLSTACGGRFPQVCSACR